MGPGAVAQLPQGGVLSDRGGGAAGAGPDARRTAVGAMLALQRAAGNRAAAAAVRGLRHAGAAGPRSVARCAGACKCGGACKERGHDEELLDEMGRRLHRAAADRPAGASSGRVLARSPITSPSFTGEPLLQDCADDKARMGVGRRDTRPTNR